MAAVPGVVCGSHPVQGRCVAPVTNIIAIRFCVQAATTNHLYALKLSTRCTKRKTTKGAIDQYVGKMATVIDFSGLNKLPDPSNEQLDEEERAMMQYKIQLLSNHKSNNAAIAGLHEACATPHDGFEGRPDLTVNEVQIEALLYELELRGISAQRTNGGDPPPEALLHDPAADVPLLVISPRSEWGVKQTLRVLHELGPVVSWAKPSTF
ncbi:hypothetical protein Purlil1_13995 [Purpureocillium lilacinum]|uniref:Uncharacterized protein n=1 Tax=Purpureocillium lilacinum TaxID=33203 RepID=A0ABR0BCN1_PURLI|nr:hypothetical protein Purlil1_13995 [Purpureocillium lilacinum]